MLTLIVLLLDAEEPFVLPIKRISSKSNVAGKPEIVRLVQRVSTDACLVKIENVFLPTGKKIAYPVPLAYSTNGILAIG